MMINTLLMFPISICTIVNIIPIISKYVITWIFSENQIEQRLKTELVGFEQEMSVISMVDEFSRYTKIQRKYIKVKEDLKKEVDARITLRTKVHIVLAYSLKILNAIIMMILVKLYREQPIIILPKGMLWPLTDILSWPGTHQDSISFLVWIGATTLVIPRLFHNMNYFQI